MGKFDLWREARDGGEPIPHFSCKHADGKIHFSMSMSLPKGEEVEQIMNLTAPLYKDQDQAQQVTVQCSTGFSVKDVFAEDAEPIPNYAIKGFSEKLDVELWEGFHKVMISTFEKMQEGDQASAMLMKMVAPMMPMYLMQLKAKLEIDVDQEDVAALMDLPQAEMAKANVH